MTDEELLAITDSISTKLGAENSALIADDLGLLMTKNSEAQNTLKSQSDQIKSLQSDKDKLVAVNGNLLQQIPMKHEAPKVKEETEVDPTKFNFKSQFDKYGNFIK